MQPTHSSRTTSVVAILAAAFLSACAAGQALAAAGDYLSATNETPGTVKLELLPANDPADAKARPLMMACIAAKESVWWPLDENAPSRIRLQVMRGNGCEESQPVACERTVDRAPGMQHVALRGDGQSCDVAAMPAPGAGLLTAGDQPCGPTGHWAPLTIVNKDTVRAMWITVYENRQGLPILAAACWMPGETRMACVDKRNLMIRAEMYSQNGYTPARHCADGIRSCDTGRRGEPGGFLVDMNRWSSGYMISMRPDGWGCYWE